MLTPHPAQCFSGRRNCVFGDDLARDSLALGKVKQGGAAGGDV